jgi:hypothetical protein
MPWVRADFEDDITTPSIGLARRTRPAFYFSLKDISISILTATA